MTSKPFQTDGTVAVIGSGYWGKNLVRNFYELGALKLICDRNETIIAHFSALYPDVDICFALNDVLTNTAIRGLVIATPAETHYTIAREALLAGKHVYVEKPLVLREEEGQELIALAAQKRCVLMVGHLLQYHPVFVKLKELALTGELGRINYIYSHRLNLGKIRREENILWSFAPHDISMILALAGEDPESVLATGGNYLHKKIYDVTTTHLEFPSGLRAHIFVSWLHPFKEQKLVVVGDKKMAVFDDTQQWPDKLLLYPHEIKWHNHMPIPTKAAPERLDILEAEPLRLECEHFLACMAHGHQPLTDGWEGLRVLKVLNAGQRSMDQQGCKCTLEDSGDEPPRDTERPAEPIVIQTASSNGYFVHDTAVVDAGCHIGPGSKIWHFSHLMPGCQIGEGCNIGQNVVIGPDVVIGNHCKIQNNVSVFQGVTLEDGVFCGPSMVFTNVINPRAQIRKMDQVRPTLVRKGATIGANATIVCGSTIGRYAFVGAGAVVTRDVPNHALVVGNPARQKGWVCECGGVIDHQLICPSCGSSYITVGSELKIKDGSKYPESNPTM